MEKNLKLEVSREFVVRDLDSIIVPGVLRYRGIPVEEFSKEQLITILYQMTYEEE